MPVWHRSVALAAAAAALAPAAAQAAKGDYCVRTGPREGCAPAETLTRALAMPDRLRIFLGEGTFTATAADGGVPVEIRGAGPARTTIGALALTSSRSLLSDVALGGRLRLAGRAERVRAGQGVDLLAGGDGSTAQLAQAVVAGTIAAAGPAQLDDVDVTAPATAGAALDVTCAGVLARHVSVTGQAAHAVRAACSQPEGAATVQLRSSLLDGADPVGVDGRVTVTTAYSAHVEDADATSTDRLELGASPVDAGDPAPLAPHEPFEDAAGDPRMADGDGNGLVRRDVGAYERQPPALAPPAGNVIANPGAEAGEPGAGVPPGWSGTFTAARYGDPFLPGARAGAALGAGAGFFSAAGAERAELLQRIDLAPAAQAIDAGGASATLSGLLGGYGADPDVVTLAAAFRDPEGATLGRVVLGPVTAAERGNATTLLHRSATAPIPARTRAIDVTLSGERRAGTYTDAYADQLALVLSVPGAPVAPPAQPTDPIVPGLRPFSGVVVLTPRPRFSRRWRAPVTVGCPSATVGRCSGSLELRATLPGAGRRPARIARFAHVSLAPGSSRTTMLQMLSDARRALAGRSRLRARLLTVSRDTQGLQRRRTVPVLLRLPAAARRR